MFLVGTLQAFGVVFILSFFYVYIRVASIYFAIDSVVFTTMSMIATALTLSLMAGPGRFITDTLKSWQTWFYAFILIAGYILNVILATHISGTEVGLIHRMALPVTLAVAFIFFHRKPSSLTLSGMAIMVIGFAMLFTHQSIDIWQIIWLPALLLICANVSHAFVTETHKQYGHARTKGNLRDRMRIVGFVSFITSIIIMLLSLCLVYVVLPLFAPSASSLVNFMPDIQDYLHAPSVLTGIFYGLIFAPVARYLTWSSGQLIKSENKLAIFALIPVLTMLMEFTLSSFSQGFTFSLNKELLFATVLVTVGASMPVLLRFYQEHKKSGLPLYKVITQNQPADMAIQHADNAYDDYDILCATLEHTKGDKAKAAKLLNIPTTTFRVLLEGEGALALKAAASKEVSRRYRTHVANRDGLTGLLNRSGFMVALKKTISAHKKGALFYIDLDKFKPVNDTYGHDAGDAILIQTTQRLQAILPEKAIITRMGGDEFCVYAPGVTKADGKTLAQALEKELHKPYKVKGVRAQIKVGASIGQAFYPADGQTPAEIISAADKGMLGVKHSWD